jgi:hypothetical protein
VLEEAAHELVAVEAHRAPRASSMMASAAAFISAS